MVVGLPHPHDRSLDQLALQKYYRPSFKAWEDFLLSVLKYVDDNTIHKKISMDGLVIVENGEKNARATRLQNQFRQMFYICP